jgi:hypothetical protein
MILEKYNMPCHAMHPMQDYFLEGFLYTRQIDMQPICTSMLAKFYSCKKWVLQVPHQSRPLLVHWSSILDQILT